MTRERVKELLPIITAFAEGKIIQRKDVEGDDDWKDIEYPTFSDTFATYRIKPEEKFRPYKNCDEMIADYCRKVYPNIQKDIFMELPLIWVKDENATSLITDFGVEGDNERVCLGAENYDMEELFNDFTYLDGSPVGAKE